MAIFYEMWATISDSVLLAFMLVFTGILAKEYKELPKERRSVYTWFLASFVLFTIGIASAVAKHSSKTVHDSKAEMAFGYAFLVAGMGLMGVQCRRLYFGHSPRVWKIYGAWVIWMVVSWIVWVLLGGGYYLFGTYATIETVWLAAIYIKLHRVKRPEARYMLIGLLISMIAHTILLVHNVAWMFFEIDLTVQLIWPFCGRDVYHFLETPAFWYFLQAIRPNTLENVPPFDTDATSPNH